MIILDYNIQAGRFEIMCKKYAMEWGNNIPSRTWNKKRGIWYAKPTRLNYDYFTENTNGAVVTPSAKSALVDLKESLERTAGDGRRFPFEVYQFKRPPLDHQRIGLESVYGLTNSAVLADIGTGKTQIAIDNFSAHRMEDDIKQVLVIALFSIRRNWEQEIGMICPLPYNVHLLDTSKAGIRRYDDFLAEKSYFKWLIVGVESLAQGQAFSQCQRFVNEETAVIVDESSRIKNHNANRTGRAIILGRKAKYRMIMTGSPITQGLEDLYSQFEFLDKNIIGLGNWYSFRNRYVIMGGYENRQVIGYSKTEELLNAVNPYIFQVRKRDVLKNLPDKTYVSRYVKPTKEQQTLYKDLKKNMYIQYNTWIDKVIGEGEKERTIKVRELTVNNALTVMQRLHEITGGIITTEELNPDPLTREKKPKIFTKNRLNKSPKIDELMVVLEETQGSVVIFAVYVEEIHMITEAIERKFGLDSYVQIYGDINEDQRHENITRFQNKEVRFLIGNQATGGTGLNMTAASTMIRYSNNFSADSRMQSDGRIERIGQTEHMHYIDLVMPGLIDERILEVLKEKEQFADDIRGSFDKGELGTVTSVGGFDDDFREAFEDGTLEEFIEGS